MTNRIQAVSTAAILANCLITCVFITESATAADWARASARAPAVSTLAAVDLPADNEARATKTAPVVTHIVLPAITARPSREINITPSISNSPADSYAECMPGAFRKIR